MHARKDDFSMAQRTYPKSIWGWLIAGLLLLGLAICLPIGAHAAGEPTATPTVSATTIPPTVTATQPAATVAPLPPTATATRSPATVTPLPTAIPTRPPATATPRAAAVNAPADTATPTATPDCPDSYEPDDDRVAQARLLLTDGQQQLHSFHRPGDKDYVKFSALASQTISLYTLNLAPGVDTFLTLYDSSGAELALNDMDPSNPAGSRINYAITRTDTYYLEVKHVNPAAGGCGLTYYLAATAAQATPTPTPAPVPGTPRLEVFRFYTVPEVVRFYEPFELFVTIRNTGTAAAQDVIFEPASVANRPSGFVADDSSTRSIGRLEIGLQATTSKRYRYVPATDDDSIDDNGAPRKLELTLTSTGQADTTANLWIRVFKGLTTITDPTVAFTRTLAKPNIIVRKSWTAPEGNLDNGAKRDVDPTKSFELVIELHNIGQVEADNVYVDFASAENANFYPVGSTAQKYIPGSLGPDGHAVASQTLRNAQLTKDSIQAFVLTIFYSFTYAGQRVQESVTQKIAIFVDAPPAEAGQEPGAEQGSASGYAPPDAGLSHNLSQETGAAASAAASASAPQVIVPSYTTDPAIPRPGEPFVLTLIVLNAGEAAVRNLLLSWPAGDLLAPANPGAAAQLLGYLGPQQAQQVTLQLIASNAAATGVHTYPVRFEYENSQGSRTAGQQNLDIALVADGLGKLQVPSAAESRSEALVAVDSYATEPATVAAGQPFVLTLVLRNLSRADARQVTVTWLGETLAPLSSGQTQYLAGLAAGQTATLTGRFYLQGEAAGGIERTPIQIGFEDSAGRAVKRQEQVSLLVAGQPKPASVEARVSQPAATSQPAAGQGAAQAAPAPKTERAGRPLLLRLLLALLGLGGQP
jgi:hypothetical protein